VRAPSKLYGTFLAAARLPHSAVLSIRSSFRRLALVGLTIALSSTACTSSEAWSVPQEHPQAEQRTVKTAPAVHNTPVRERVLPRRTDTRPREPEIRVPDLDCSERPAVGYRRGKRFSIELVTIDGAPIERATANAYWAMREAAAKDGVELTIYSAFRSPQEQEYFYQCYRTCSCNGCSQAAKPGFSNHQSGHAVDIAVWSPDVHPWLVANAAKFGFAATVPKEPWHWEFRGKPRKDGVCR
jgi:LAS superfamily LD-carboxypeptidase LdcB